ncbi:MAG: glutathione peroxidase [Verrucomicrobiaceae bacterium]|nr:glutathione peroxidase [Verrucomicrobiaceae bacterium]
MWTRNLVLLIAALFTQQSFAVDANCPAWMNESKRLLRSDNSKNLCDAYRGKPLLIVNTASHCGFTPQFKGLEALSQRYKSQGLVVIGFPSDDFKQEDKAEEKTAEVCYANYGVTFDMYAPISVSGDSADPLYKELAKQGGGYPKWNFYKYLVNRDGVVVKRFSSFDKPDSDDMHSAIEKVLATPAKP